MPGKFRQALPPHAVAVAQRSEATTRIARVKKSNGRLYWFGAPGIVAESDLSGNLTAEYIFFGGERIARRDLPSGTVHYYFSYHLKSTSVVTSATGAIEEESDYHTWGEESAITHTLADQHYKFNGKERDPETGFDEFGARLYNSAWGRWLIPDWSANPTPVPYAQMDNPQSLNLYAYVLNNPTTLPDADGHFAGLLNPSPESLSQGDEHPQEDEVQQKIDQAKQELAAMGATYLIAEASQGAALQNNSYHNMSLSAGGLQFIKSYETFQAKPYRDGDQQNLTIGYGHKILPGEQFTQITQQQALQLLAKDVSGATNAVNKALGGINKPVSQHQFDALVSLVFNSGPTAVKRSNNIIRTLQSGASLSLSHFAAYSHVRKSGRLVTSRGLMNRRLDEWELYSRGDYRRDH